MTLLNQRKGNKRRETTKQGNLETGVNSVAKKNQVEGEADSVNKMLEYLRFDGANQQ